MNKPLFLLLTLWSFALSAQTFPDLSKTNPTGGGENDAALVIAIEDYAFLPDIAGAEQNGKDWYLHFTRGMKIPATEVTFLRNQEATREEIQKAVKNLAAARRPGGKLWLVFIGHGAPSPNADGSGILIGVDAQQNADSLTARSVSQDSISKPLELATAGSPGDAIVVLDACFSGKSSGGQALVPGLQPVLAVQNIKSSVVFLSAADSDEFAGPLPGKKRPAYSYLALGALRGWADENGDQSVSADELTQYVNDTMKIIVNDRTQTANHSAPTSQISLNSNVNEQGPDWVSFVSSQTKKPTNPTISNLGGVKQSSTRKGHKRHVNVQFQSLAVDFPSYFVLTDSVGVDSNAFKSYLELAVEPTDQANIESTLGAQAEVLFGDRGFITGGALAVGFTNASVPVEVWSVDPSAEQSNSLAQGTIGTLSGFTFIDLRSIVGYRFGIGRLTLSPRIEPGLQMILSTLDVTLDGNSNSIFLSPLRFALPVSLMVGYDIFDTMVINAQISSHLMPVVELGLHVGAGFYF